MKYQEALEYIGSIQSYGIVPGLENITELCARLGDPQKRLAFVHIAGTNGKGSTLAYLSTILKCAGYRVGRYSSPAVLEYRERIQVNGRNITQKALCEGVEIIQNICYEMTKAGFAHPTPFEVETALAFWYFERTACDIVVLETGMGGLYDATNVIDAPLAAVLTPVSMDHMGFLGKSLAEIAAHKAGIIKEGCAVVSARQEPEAEEVVRRTAQEKHCPLSVADPACIEHLKRGGRQRTRFAERQVFDYRSPEGAVLKKLEIRLGGSFQPENALLALLAVERLRERGMAVGEAAIRRGLRETVWRGRFEAVAVKPLLVVDGAHNEDAARKLAQSVEFYFTNRRIIYIIGVLRDKEYPKMIALTHMLADQIITVTPPENPRALSAYDLAQEIAKVHPSVTAVDSLEEAVEMARLLAGPEDVIVAFGSLSYLGKLIRIVEG
ncbi:MAG: bifunctional folylpolyglutamate synthase/dihydrofolate synthase [Muribaculum sp.]|nr:bifunctional folylpolyglutamate synthase/dihydrofolate synthase [Muribaculum sp.]